MRRKQFSILVVALGILCLAGPVGAAPLTSSNGLDVVGYTTGSAVPVYTAWAATLVGGSILGEASGAPGSAFYGITGFSGTLNTGAPFGNGYAGIIDTPMVLTMPNLAAFTGLELALQGSVSVTLTLSDNSTVTTGVLNFGSTTNSVTFISPIQIVSAEIDSSSSGTALADVAWGTADLAQLPTQPQQGQGPGDDQSPTPEGSTLWLMGGGLLGLSHLIRKRKHLLN